MTLKKDLIKQAQDLGITTDKLTIAQLKEAINEIHANKENESQDSKQNENQSSVNQEKEQINDSTINDQSEFAKAGKRSKKVVEEKQAELERQARKDQLKEIAKPKMKITPPRPLIERRSKKYKEASKHFNIKQTYNLDEALEIVIKTSTTKFDSSIDLAINLGVDPKKADQNIRDSVVLPNGNGKTAKIAVYADEDIAQEALKSGAKIAGKDTFLQQLDKEQIDFSVLITTPDLMASLAKYAKLLGPKGLMPNPKSGTVTKDILKAIEQVKKGKTEYRVDENGIVHLSIGRVSFGTSKLKNNLEAVVDNINSNKPNNLKGNYIKSVYLSTTMGPSIEVNL